MSDTYFKYLVKYLPSKLNFVIRGVFKLSSWRVAFISPYFYSKRSKKCSKRNKVEFVLDWIKPSIFDFQKVIKEIWNRNCSTIIVSYWENSHYAIFNIEELQNDNLHCREGLIWFCMYNLSFILTGLFKLDSRVWVRTMRTLIVLTFALLMLTIVHSGFQQGIDR